MVVEEKEGEVMLSPSASVKIMRVWYCRRCEGRGGKRCEGVSEGGRKSGWEGGWLEHQPAQKRGRRLLWKGREGGREGGSK